MKPKRIRSLVAGAAAVTLLAALGSSAGAGGTASSPPTDGGAGGDTAVGTAALTIGMPNGTQTDNSNPFLNTSSAQSLGYAYVIYEPVAQVNDIQPSADPTPWLATDWTWTDDYTAVTFTARDGVTWSDGEPFTADDLAFSYQIRMDNEALNLDAIPYSGVTVDGNQVTVEFSSGQYVNQSTVLRQFVVPEHLWADVEDPTTFTNDEPVGTGPYVLDSWTPQAVKLSARDDYWGGTLAVPELQYTSYTDNSAMISALQSGDLQWGWTFIADYENVYVSKDPDHYHQFAPSGLGVDALYLNTATAPFDDVAVRKALQMVLDRQLISDISTSGVFPPITSVTGLPTPAGDDYVTTDFEGQTYTTDVEGAQALLADAGYTLDGDTLMDPDGNAVTFSLTNPTGWSDYLSTLQIISEAVKPLGIEATVDAMDADSWFSAIADGDFQASLHWTDGRATPWNTYADMMDGSFYEELGTHADWNFGRFQNDDATAALATYAGTTDDTERADALATIQQVFVDEVPAIPVLARPSAAQYSTANYVGWPSDDDPYANPQPTGIQASLILMTLVPAGG